MFGETYEQRRSRRRRSKSSNPELILVLALAFQVFAAKVGLFSPLDFRRHYRVEAFVPFGRSAKRIHRRTRCSFSKSTRSGRVASSFCSFFIPNMATRNDDDNGSRFTSNNQGRSQRNREPQQDERHKDTRRREATTGAAPMYITIGPQCCGKSSFLRNHKEGTIKDVSLDDQQDVYVPIPTDVFLQAYDDEGTDSKPDNERTQLLQQVYQGKTLAERIRENVELILILRRWNGDSSASEFERRVKSYYEERELSEAVAIALVKTVEDFLSNQPDLPKETDVFVLESLFKPHPQTRQSAIQRAHEELRETPKHIPIAWGNTNSKAKDYERVLEICHQMRRPVRFVLCHPACGSHVEANNESELLTLAWLPLEELLKRNLHRLKTQGRFVPANAIADCYQRVVEMIPPNLTNIESDNSTSKAIEEHLVAIASPSAGGRGPRRPDNRRPGATFRYTLTKHRLIQKEYPRNNAGNPYSNQRRNNPNRNAGRYGRGRGPGRGNQRRRHNDGINNARRFGGDDRNRSDRNLGSQPPDQDDGPPRSRMRYNN